MALVSGITINLVTKTAVLTCTTSGNPVETITYTDSSGILTFSARPSIIISKSEFLDLINQISILETAILFNFQPNSKATLPFNSVGVEETYDPGDNIWWSVGVFGDVPNVYEYYAIGADKTVQLQTREGDKSIFFAEWIYFLYSINHFKNSVVNFFSI